MDKQFCPKCGNELKQGAKFCPKCGAQLNEQSNVNNSDASVATKQFTSGYFNWWIDTVKHPSIKRENQNSYFGLTSFIIMMILGWIMVSKGLSDFQDVVTVGTGEFLKMLGFTGLTIVSASKIDIFIVIMIALYVFIAYFAKTIANAKNNVKINIYDFINELAGYTNTVMILLVLIILSLFLSISFNFIKIVMLLLFINSFVGFICSVVDIKKENKFDKLTIAFVAFLVFVIITKVVLSGMIQ